MHVDITIRYLEIAIKFKIQVIVDKINLIINRYFDRSSCTYYSLNIFVRFTTMLCVLYNVTFLDYDSKSYKRRFFSTFNKSLKLIINIIFIFNIEFLFFNQD